MYIMRNILWSVSGNRDHQGMDLRGALMLGQMAFGVAGVVQDETAARTEAPRLAVARRNRELACENHGDLLARCRVEDFVPTRRRFEEYGDRGSQIGGHADRRRRRRKIA